MNKAYFADSFYFMALLNPDDGANKKAWRFSEEIEGPIITTEFVLLEVADAFRAPKDRLETSRFIEQLLVAEDVRVIQADHELFKQGLNLYKNRADKFWSLTDCISFVVMEKENISEALTGDKHFLQAGFKPLLIKD